MEDGKVSGRSKVEDDHRVWLETQVEAYREEERKREAEWMRDREREREERQRRVEASFRTARNWPEALQNQAFLCRREHRVFEDAEEGSAFFSESAEACERAVEFWFELEAARQEEVDALLARVVAIGEEIRLEVAERLEAEKGDREGWEFVVNALRDDEDPEEWLNW